MFFPHLATNHKGILNAMATEQAIPVQATFPDSASSVTLVLWGSTGCPALLEALDKNGAGRRQGFGRRRARPQGPSRSVPFFELTVKGDPAIAAIRFSGPRNGEFLAADEIRFTTVDAK